MVCITRAPSLALLMITNLEGALILARPQRELTPLDVVVTELGPVLDAAVRPQINAAAGHIRRGPGMTGKDRGPRERRGCPAPGGGAAGYLALVRGIGSAGRLGRSWQRGRGGTCASACTHWA